MRPGERVLNLMLAPIQRFLDGADVTEITIQRPGEVGVEAAGVWTWHAMPELTFDYLMAIATLAAAQTQQDVDATIPGCASVLPGKQRIQIEVPPLVAGGTVTLCIRCPPRFKPTLKELAHRGAFRQTRLIGEGEIGDWAGFFAAAVRAHKTIVVTGSTGSGKTTLGRALMAEVPDIERLVTIEDTPELALDRRNMVSLFYSKGGQSIASRTPEQLIEEALRLRPDRVIMGELRDGAAWAWLRLVASGHPGSIVTLHARDSQDALSTLRLLVKQHEAGGRMTDADILTLAGGMVDIVAHCEKGSDGFRGVTEVFLRRSVCSSLLSSAA